MIYVVIETLKSGRCRICTDRAGRKVFKTPNKSGAVAVGLRMLGGKISTHSFPDLVAAEGYVAQTNFNNARSTTESAAIVRRQGVV